MCSAGRQPWGEKNARPSLPNAVELRWAVKTMIHTDGKKKRALVIVWAKTEAPPYVAAAEGHRSRHAAT